MELLIAITVYDMDGACEKLAKLTKKKDPYSHQRLRNLILNNPPIGSKIGRGNFLTEDEIKWLANKLKLAKRPKIY